MPRERILPRTLRYERDSVPSAEVPPPLCVPDPEVPSTSNERPLGANFSGPMSHANYGPPGQYTNNYGDQLPRAEGVAEQHMYHRSQGDGVSYPPHGIAEDILIAPGPPLLEYYAQPAHPQEIPNDPTIGRTPFLFNVAGPSQGIPGPVPSRMSAAEDLRLLANQYLRRPDSRVDRVRIRQSRHSGRVKVMIMLEIDEMV